jgi:putative membrane protein
VGAQLAIHAAAHSFEEKIMLMLMLKLKFAIPMVGMLVASSVALAQASAPSRTTPAAAAGSAAAPKATASKLTGADRNFIVTAAEDGMAEVELGKLAQQKGSHEAVKTFGTQMVTDHTKAGDELKALAGTKDITLPSGPGKHQKDIDKLGRTAGADFDRDYAKQMVNAHKSAVALFEKTARSGKDGDVKAFAAKTLPTLKQHLEHARSLEASVKGGGKKAG